ncbi:MAG: helix-turn-helix domain-containing protein [Casimicrobiaceae bacterium]
MTTTTADLVHGVLALIGTRRDDPNYRTRALAVLDLCALALNATRVAVPLARLDPAELGVRIAELRASGLGIRAIARHLGVHASTVSRRLRRTDLPRG